MRRHGQACGFHECAVARAAMHDDHWWKLGLALREARELRHSTTPREANGDVGKAAVLWMSIVQRRELGRCKAN